VPNSPSDRNANVHQPIQTRPAGAPKKGGPLSGGLGLVVAVVLFAGAAFLLYRSFWKGVHEAAEPVEATFMCIETGKTFRHAMELEEKWPVVSPFTNRLTGYPTEQCYWTKDGKRKKMPTYVVLNEHLNKPGDTICPDCGRIVVGHNPLPPPGTPQAGEPSAAPMQPTTKPG
jgi:hypothetical protein